jgi:hypothetical protein
MPWRGPERKNRNVLTRSQLTRLGVVAWLSSLLTLFVRNFISGEKKIRRRIARRLILRAGSSNGRRSSCLGRRSPVGDRIKRLEDRV